MSNLLVKAGDDTARLDTHEVVGVSPGPARAHTDCLHCGFKEPFDASPLGRPSWGQRTRGALAGEGPALSRLRTQYSC